MTKQPLPDNRAGIFDKLEADRLIVRDVGGRWNNTNLGAILFAMRLGDFDASLARKAVRFVAYGGKNRAATVTHRNDGQKGYAVGFQGLVAYINGLLPLNEHIGIALREARPLFPELAIRDQQDVGGGPYPGRRPGPSTGGLRAALGLRFLDRVLILGGICGRGSGFFQPNQQLGALREADSFLIGS